MNSEEESGAEEAEKSSKSLPFKKPLLIGKVGRLPRKITNVAAQVTAKEPAVAEPNAAAVDNEPNTNGDVEPREAPEKNAPLRYKEPTWSGLPKSSSKDYAFQVLKSGAVIESINVMNKPYWVFGRLATCDICMAHPTVSRYHAILQYRSQASDDQPTGFYLYDLASTHGTFLNKARLKPRAYARVQVGHMIRFGCSTRTFLLTGPAEDTEEESEFSITELRQRRAEDLLKREEMAKETELRIRQEEETKQKMLEEKGVNWGMGEDADEEADIAENPFAQTNNEDLYLADPKKALRGFMEREGHDLEYDCTEQGMGQFLCKVELPVDDERGRPILAEVLHKGKKKEAVVQCALEACRILDRYGLLRQATHESRKRKVKNWEENDFYDSDDDTFLDRTGIIEKKRENRMKAKVPQQPETYQSLMEKQKNVNEEISSIEKLLSDSNKRCGTSNHGSTEEDTLDSYMNELKQSKLDKQKISKLKTDLHKLKQEHGNLSKLVNIAKPANLPALVEQQNREPSAVNAKRKLPLYGKRLKVKVQMPVRSSQNVTNTEDDEEDEDDIKKVDEEHSLECKKIESSLRKLFTLMTTEHETQVGNIWNAIKNDTKPPPDVLNLLSNYIDGVDPTIKQKVTKETDEIIAAINNTKTATVFEIGTKLINVVKEVTHLVNKFNDAAAALDKDDDEVERKRKKNQRRIQQRQERAEMEKQRGYEEDASKEDYNMWIPPEGQTGDGRTCLNDKLGY